MKDHGFIRFNYKRNEVTEAKVREFRKQMIELGIDYAEFDGTDTEYDEDVEIARDYIYNGKDVPDDVRERLLERKDRLNKDYSRILFENNDN